MIRRLGDVCRVLNGRAYKLPELLDSGKYRILRVGNFFTSDRWYYSDMELDEDKYCERGDLLFAWSASFGPKIWDGERVIYHYHIWKLLPDHQILDKHWLYYWLQCTCSSLTSGVHGSVMAHMTKSEMEDTTLPLPDLPTQKKIAAVLSALDDKIENNRRICKTLEEMAQAIFKSWFVDFEPWGGVMPDGWRREPLSNVADFLNGLAMQKYRPKDGEGSLPVLKIKELRQGYCDETSEACSANIPEKFIIHDGDVIFSWSGSLLVDFWCGGTVGLNQHLFKVTSPRFPKWYVYAWTQYHLASFIKIAADKATTMGHITRDHLDDALAWVPDLLTMNQLGDLLSSVYDLLISCRLENRSLSSMRDALLPKLMSGEIDVDKVEV